MSTRATIEEIRTDLTSAENLLTGFYLPWDESDTRPLCLLKDVLDAQQRALVAMLARIESSEKINAAHRGRVDRMEYAW